MNLHAARTILNEIQYSPLIELASSRHRDLLTSLNDKMKLEIENIFQNSQSVEHRMALEEISDKLPAIIPELEGQTQVYFAKLYRVCRLLLDKN